MSRVCNLARSRAQRPRARVVPWLTGLLMPLLLPGCASLQGGAPEEVVARRAVERAAFLMKGDFESAYQYTTPGYRTLETVREYSGRWVGGTMWQDVKVVNVECEEEPVARCQLVLAVTFNSLQTGLLTTHLQETWVKSGRDWYLYQQINR